MCKCMCVYKENVIYISPFFIHSSIGGKLACFHILASVNNPAVNMAVQIPLQHSGFLFPSDLFPEVELLKHMVVLFLIFLRSLHIVFHMPLPPTAQMRSLFHIFANT